jgi:hypothetical protein
MIKNKKLEFVLCFMFTIISAVFAFYKVSGWGWFLFTDFLMLADFFSTIRKD